MDFSTFKTLYDKPDSIVLLEGKREVLESDKEWLSRLSQKLINETQWMKFRSGNASGADELFCQTIAEMAPERLELVLPYATHRKKTFTSYPILKYSLDEMDMTNEPTLVYESKIGSKNDKLVDLFAKGDRNRNTIKASYLIRDTAKVIGSSTFQKSKIALFYDDLENPKQGGTGQTMQVCEKNGIEFLDQRIWMKWLKK